VEKSSSLSGALIMETAGYSIQTFILWSSTDMYCNV
jgi:hypothetical protein